MTPGAVQSGLVCIVHEIRWSRLQTAERFLVGYRAWSVARSSAFDWHNACETHCPMQTPSVDPSAKTVEHHYPTAWMNVASFDHPDDAENLARVLNKHGIDARVQDERRLQKNWFLVRRCVAGIHVRVPETIFAYTEQYLEKHSSARQWLDAAVHCPACHSTRIQFPQMPRENVLPTLVAQCLVLVGLMKQAYCCEACQYTWVPAKRRLVSPAPRRTLVSTPRKALS